MKKQTFFSIVVAIATSMTINAQIIALHSSTGVQMFKGNTAFADAYTAAQNGDTIYLSGNSFTPPAEFNKQLMILGAGHYPDSTVATGKTFINGQVQLRESADNFYLEGVEVTGNVIFYSNEAVDGVIIKRCKINGQFNVLGDLSNPSSNLGIVGNVLGQRINLENAETALLSNNIIVNTFMFSNGNLINNNIIMGFIWGSSMDYLFYGNNNSLNNNIFLWEGYNANVNGSGNIFNNNLYVEPAPNYGTTATSTGNYTGILQGDIFVSQTGTAFSYLHNYHLKSPTTYTGAEGSQVGVYGGIFPYKEGAVPLNPHIQVKNIASTTDANGNLQIQIQVGAQKD